MITIASKDIIKTPSYITQPKDITFVEDAKKHIIKSVVFPYALYEQLREKIEDELYIIQNKEALSEESFSEFLEIEEIVEELA
nr:hypothetical protein [Sulfurimonas sp. SAG-AH-194-C21]